MENKVLAPILAGIGLGWLAFSPEGQKMAKSVGQTLMPALSPGQGKDGEKDGPEGKDAEGKADHEGKPGKGDKDEEEGDA